MHKKWIKYLCDPFDKTQLRLYEVSEKKDNDIISGKLKSESGNVYKINNGVPVLLGKNCQLISTVDSFGYEWEKFDFNFGKKGWLIDIVRPSLGSLKAFKDKVVIDCGSGSGRQSLWMAQAGAKMVFSIELSGAARTIIKKVTKKYRDKICVIQADIAHLPINTKALKIDIVYCVNVIQHTKNPKKTIKEIAGIMSYKSPMLFNIYIEKGRKIQIRILKFLRKTTKNVPPFFLRWSTFLLTCTLYLFSYLPFIGSKFKKTFYFSHNFKSTWLNFYDILGSHTYQKFYPEKELLSMFKTSSLKIIKRSRYIMVVMNI